MANILKVWTIRSGDKLPMIAAKAYGDPGLWRLIADANNIQNPLNFPDTDKDLGRVLLIPSQPS